MIRIEHAGLAQAPDVASLYVRTRRLAYAPFFPADALAAMSVAVETERWSLRLQAESTDTLVALDADGAIAGFTCISWRDEAHPLTGEVEYMYVATEHQGNGLGARLMAEAEARLAAAGMHDAILWVYERNTPARAFYERCGWSHDGGLKASESAPGQHLARYRKPLRITA